jgi:hypothetical protein
MSNSFVRDMAFPFVMLLIYFAVFLLCIPLTSLRTAAEIDIINTPLDFLVSSIVFPAISFFIAALIIWVFANVFKSIFFGKVRIRICLLLSALLVMLAANYLFSIVPRKSLIAVPTGRVLVQKFGGEGRDDVQSAYDHGIRTGEKEYSGGGNANILIILNAIEINLVLSLPYILFRRHEILFQK